MKRIALGSVVLCLVLAGMQETRADEIPVVNFSFEDPVLSPGQYTTTSPPGWGSVRQVGVFYPVVGTHVSDPVPDGNQVGVAGNVYEWGVLFQDLGVPVEEGAVYQLDVFVGSRLEGYPAHYLVALTEGPRILGETQGTIDPVTGEFFPVSLTAIGTGSGNLGIVLSETQPHSQVLFDDVHLQINPDSP